MKWSKEIEEKAVALRSEGKTYREIGLELNTTETSVKHKIRRIQQNGNDDRYKHTAEKLNQMQMCLRVFNLPKKSHILETHCGYGGMTNHYAKLAEVECYDIVKERSASVNLQHENVTAIHANSELELYRLIAHKCKYDVVDIDPYGLPSRYFPHAFGLIDDGLMFLTFPVMGVAQINKITIRHYQAFWGIELSDKEFYLDIIKSKLEDFAFQHKRSIEFIDSIKIGRIYRIAMRVRKESLCEIVGLKVNR
jgi:tRNA G26 N,N-dimethylase Trm1